MGGDLYGAHGCSNLSVGEAEGYQYTPFQEIFILNVVPVVTFFGLLTNSAFLYVIYCVPAMRTPTNFYLANLAVSDAVLLIVTTSNYLWTYFKMPIDYGYPFGSTGCAISMWVIYVFSFASIAFLTLVALERYQAVCRPLHYRQRNVSSHPLYENMKFTLLTWISLIVIVATPIAFVRIDYKCFNWPPVEPFSTYPSVVHNCQWPDWTWIFLDGADIIEFSIALFINVVVYINIVRELSKRQRPKGKSSASRSHVARMLCINAFIFFLCLFPIQLSNVAEIHYFITKTNEAFYGDAADSLILWIGRVAFLLNSSVNPIIYSISNPEYRKAFRKSIPRTGRKEQRTRLNTFSSNTNNVDLDLHSQRETSQFIINDD